MPKQGVWFWILLCFKVKWLLKSPFLTHLLPCCLLPYQLGHPAIHDERPHCVDHHPPPPPSYIDVIVALKPPLSSLVEVSPALLIPIQQHAVAGQLLHFFRLSLGTPSRSFHFHFLRLSCSDSPLPSSSGDLAHHLFTLLVPCLLLLIHPKSNPTLLLELVIEVILRLL